MLEWLCFKVEMKNEEEEDEEKTVGRGSNFVCESKCDKSIIFKVIKINTAGFILFAKVNLFCISLYHRCQSFSRAE